MSARVSIDLSSVYGGSPGIARATLRVLDSWLCTSRDRQVQSSWFLYGRSNEFPILPIDPSIDIVRRGDRLPASIGRLFSPLTTIPVWLSKDRPSAHWGPAHRLPSFIPDRTRSIVTIHDICWKRHPETMHPLSYLADAAFMPTALSRADVIVAVSNATAEDITHYWPSVSSKIRVIPLGVDSDYGGAPDFATRSPFAFKFGRFFLSVGTIEPRKNLLRVIKAYAFLCQRNSSFPSLVIVGKKGWKSDSPLVMARELGVADRVWWLQSADDDQLKQLYRQAVALVFPSLYEGFGLPVLEAMAAGTPVITSNCASLPEVAGDAALLVDPLRLDQIREAMQALASDDLLRARLSSQGRERAKQFSWDSTASQMLEVFSGR
jgi:glycosyltransferase involved in cell wall biosynthesis